MNKSTVNRTQIFFLRIQQIQNYYELSTAEFASKLNVDPEKFELLAAGELVDSEFILTVIDQLHQQMKLDFEWFLTYNLAIIPDLSECLNTLLYNRDALARRIQARRQTVQWMMHGLVDELGAGIADPDSRDVFSSNWMFGKLE